MANNMKKIFNIFFICILTVTYCGCFLQPRQNYIHVNSSTWTVKTDDKEYFIDSIRISKLEDITPDTTDCFIKLKKNHRGLSSLRLLNVDSNYSSTGKFQEMLKSGDPSFRIFIKKYDSAMVRHYEFNEKFYFRKSSLSIDNDTKIEIKNV